MAETLGSLCDKLTIVKLKQYHSEDAARLQSLKQQEQQLQARAFQERAQVAESEAMIQRTICEEQLKALKSK